MRTRGKRRTYTPGPFRIARAGLRITSVTVDLGLWHGILWEAKRRG